jgi:hypothetical protein
MFPTSVLSQILCTFSTIPDNAHQEKGKVLPRTGHEGPEGEWRYSSTLSLTSALDEGGWSTPRPSCFTPRKKTRYPLYRRLGGPQGRSGRLRKISPPPGFDPRTVQPAASRYTNYAKDSVTFSWILHSMTLYFPTPFY